MTDSLPNFYNVRVAAREYKEYTGHTTADDLTIAKDDVMADSPETAVTQVVQDNGFHNGPRRSSISGKWIFLDYPDEEGNDHYVELDGELGDYAAPVVYDRRLAGRRVPVD